MLRCAAQMYYVPLYQYCLLATHLLVVTSCMRSFFFSSIFALFFLGISKYNPLFVEMAKITPHLIRQVIHLPLCALGPLQLLAVNLEPYRSHVAHPNHLALLPLTRLAADNLTLTRSTGHRLPLVLCTRSSHPSSRRVPSSPCRSPG